MSTIKHTKEPWRVNHPNAGQRGFEVAGGDRFIEQACDHLTEENARRIVACVNACEGLSDDALDGGWSFKEISAYAKSLEAQRDELLGKLKNVLNVLDELYLDMSSAKYPQSVLEGIELKEMQAVRVAIAKAEGRS